MREDLGFNTHAYFNSKKRLNQIWIFPSVKLSQLTKNQ